MGATALAVLASCGGAEVDWSDYSPEFHQAVQQAVADGDCGQMGEQFLAAKGSHDGDLMAYVDRAMRDADCR